MNKLLSRIFLLAVVILIITACTHNNGDIGPLFGNWKLDKAEYLSMQPLEIDRPMFWAFQNTTFRCIYQDNPPEGTITYGNFRLDDNTLFLNFPDEGYPPPQELRIPAESEWQVLRLTHSDLTVRYSPSPGSSVTLYFKKW